MVDAFLGQNKLIFRTDVDGNLERKVGKVGFETQLCGNSNTYTVVLAIAYLCTRASIPTQPVGKTAFPLIDTCQIEKVEIRQIHSQVELKTVSCQALLIGYLSAILGAATETETQCILCVCSNSEGKYCH